MPNVRVCSDVAEFACLVAEAAATLIKEAVQRTGRCSLVLSGGATPHPVYAWWASRLARAIPWESVHVFWGDERYVPLDGAQSNYRMAREALLDHVPCPSANIHPVPTHLSTPDLAARAYEATLRNYAGDTGSRFDLVLLGLGADGHTASLFPGSPALDETSRWVVPTVASVDPPSRVTLTFPALNAAAHTYFLVTGPEKAHALTRILEGAADEHVFPAAGVRPHSGAVVWWVDREAAAQYRPRS